MASISHLWPIYRKYDPIVSLLDAKEAKIIAQKVHSYNYEKLEMANANRIIGRF